MSINIFNMYFGYSLLTMDLHFFLLFTFCVSNKTNISTLLL